MKSVISGEMAEEVRRLWAEYEQAIRDAQAAFVPDGTDPEFKGERLERHIEADRRAGEAISRIRKIYGET